MEIVLKPIILLSLTISFSFSFNCKNDCESIKKILSNKQVYSYLHREVKNRSVLYLLENELCCSDLKIKNNLKVAVIKKAQLKKVMNYIAITSVKELEDGNKIISINYPIEGAIFRVHFNGSNIKSVEVIEK